MTCEECQNELEDFLYGELTERRAAEARAHLAECGACRAVRAGLEAENEIFTAFYEQSASEPSTEAWAAIRDRIRAEPAPATAAEPASRWWDRFRDLSLLSVLRQAAVGALLIALSVAGTVYVLKRGGSGSRELAGGAPSPTPARVQPTPSPITTPETRPAPLLASAGKAPAAEPRRLSENEMIQQQIARAEREYQGAVRLLDRAIARRRDSLDPAILRQYEASLALIDDSIQQSRQAIRQQPNDVSAGQFLLAAYARKIELMQDIAMR